MPRQARLDAPGTLHHVIIRDLERGAIVKDDADREAFVKPQRDCDPEQKVSSNRSAVGPRRNSDPPEKLRPPLRWLPAFENLPLSSFTIYFH